MNLKLGKFKMSAEGIIYVLTNEAMEGYVKVGRTKNLDDPLRSLYNSSIPYPFHREKAVKVADMIALEKALHDVLDTCRANPNREFFEVSPEKIFKILDTLAIEDVTPISDLVENEADKIAIQRKKSQRPAIQMITMLGLEKGQLLTNDAAPNETCSVASDRSVIFRDEEISLTAARNILKEEYDLGGCARAAATVLWKCNGVPLRQLYIDAYSDFDA